MKDAISPSKLYCEKAGCYSEIGTKDYIRTFYEAKNWPDKNMPIALCPKHAIGRLEVKKVRFINGEIKIMVAEDLVLPPHIKVIQGAYFNTLNNKWIGAYKIDKICNDYWANEQALPVIPTGGGTVVFKKNFETSKPNKADNGFKTKKEIALYDDPIIIPQAIKREIEPIENIYESKSGEEKSMTELIVNAVDEYQEAVSTKNEDTEPDNLKMSISDYWQHRGYSKAWFYFRKSEGFIKFIDKNETIVDVLASDKLLDEREKAKNKRVKSGGIKKGAGNKKKWGLPSDEHFKAVDERIAKENAEFKAKQKEKPKTTPTGEKIKWVDRTKLIKPDINPLKQAKIDEYKQIDEQIEHLFQRKELFEKRIAELEKKERELIEYQTLPIYSIYERIDIDEKDVFNTISCTFLLEEHTSLEALIEIILKSYGVDWSILKKGVIKQMDSNGNEYWYEEYLAMICHSIYCGLPINNRLEWLSKFLNRSINGIEKLLGIHYTEYYGHVGDGWHRDDFYMDFYCDICYKIIEYFKRYYKFDYSFDYRYDKKLL